jgi:hypothetical protein
MRSPQAQPQKLERQKKRQGECPDALCWQVPAARQAQNLLLVATLVARLAKKLAVLLLRHALAALLDDRTHGNLTKIGDAATGRDTRSYLTRPTASA